jgi:hypothetical protein
MPRLCRWICAAALSTLLITTIYAMPAQATGSGSLALAKARGTVSALAIDMQVLEQWAHPVAAHSILYYQRRLAQNKGYADVIRVAAQAQADDRLIQAQMRAAMPHQAIMVSLAEQVLRAYQDGQLAMTTYVTTGRPELPTVTGHFAIYAKKTPIEFISPWPPGSPYYYPPTWATYWMPFYEGYGLHDAWWRKHFGPGTNINGDGPGSAEPTGSHGCVNMPFSRAQWLWNWAPIGTPVVVYDGN